jgi:hypothetical protein
MFLGRVGFFFGWNIKFSVTADCLVVVLVRVCARHSVPPCFSEPNVVLPPVGNGLGMISRESISNLVPRPPIASDLLVVLAPLLKIFFCVVFSVQRRWRRSRGGHPARRRRWCP